MFAGKQLEILALTLLAVTLGMAPMPGGTSLAKAVRRVGHLLASASRRLCSASLSYPAAPALLAEAKLGILLGSLAAGLCGAALLRLTPVVPSR